MQRFIFLLSLICALNSSRAQEVRHPGTGFSAIPSEIGGQDIFGPYDIVENWPKDTATVVGHEEWTFAAVRGVFAQSPDRILAVQLGAA